MSNLKQSSKKTLSLIDEAFYRNGFYTEAPIVFPFQVTELKAINKAYPANKIWLFANKNF